MRPGTRTGGLAWVLALLLLGATQAAHAYAHDSHDALARAALNRLPPAARARLAPHEALLFQGVAAAAADADAPDVPWVDPTDRVQHATAAATRLRTLQGEATPFLAFALGRLAVDVAHITLPYGLYRGRHAPPFLRQYEALFESATLRPASAKPAPADTGPHLATAARRAAARQALVREDAARGFPAESPTARAAPQVFEVSAAHIAQVWLAVLDSASVDEQPAAATLRLSLDQIRFGVREASWPDVQAGLERLADGGHTVPLTPGNVGPGFFVMHERGAECSLYALAGRVDPRSRRVGKTLATCTARAAAPPPQPVPAAPGPPPAGLSSADRTGIRVFRHRGGTVYLTNRHDEMGDAFVPLNFEPIRRYVPPEPVAQPTARPPADLEAIVQFYAGEYAVDSALVKAVIYAESDFDPNVVSRAGARGLMQLMPTTALEMGVEDIFDPMQNVAGGTQYLAMMLKMFDNDLTLALAAYNAGPGTVMRYGGVPPYEETRHYIPKVLARAEQYRKTGEEVALPAVAVAAAKPDPAYLPEDPVLASGAVVVLRNGLTMRGLRAVDVENGVRLEVDTGWILVPKRNVERVMRATG